MANVLDCLHIIQQILLAYVQIICVLFFCKVSFFLIKHCRLFIETELGLQQLLSSIAEIYVILVHTLNCKNPGKAFKEQ